MKNDQGSRLDMFGEELMIKSAINLLNQALAASLAWTYYEQIIQRWKSEAGGEQ